MRCNGAGEDLTCAVSSKFVFCDGMQSGGLILKEVASFSDLVHRSFSGAPVFNYTERYFNSTLFPNSEGLRGYVYFNDDMWSEDAFIAVDGIYPWPYMVAAHEIAHVIHLSSVLSSSTMKSKFEGCLDTFCNSINETEAIQNLRNIVDTGMGDIYSDGKPFLTKFDADLIEIAKDALKAEEIWARAYCQFLSEALGEISRTARHVVGASRLQDDLVKWSNDDFTKTFSLFWFRDDLPVLIRAVRRLLSEAGLLV